MNRGKRVFKPRPSGAIFLSKAGISEQIVEKSGGWKNSAMFHKIHEYAGQTINEKGIAADALSRYEL